MPDSNDFSWRNLVPVSARKKIESDEEALVRKRERDRRVAAVRRADPAYREKQKAYLRIWYAANKEAINAARRKAPWEKKKPGPPKRFTEEEQKAKHIARAKARMQNPEYLEKHKAYLKEYHAREDVREKRKEWLELNPERRKKYNATNRLRNLEKIRARDREFKREQCARLDEAYIKNANRKSRIGAVDLLVRAASIIYHRTLKGEMNVEQANEILERLGSTARIPTAERAAE